MTDPDLATAVRRGCPRGDIGAIESRVGRRWLIVVLAVIAASVAAALLWPSDDDPPPEAADPPEEDPLVEDDFALFFEEAGDGRRDEGPERGRDARRDRPEQGGEGFREVDREKRRERRREWREKMRNMSPEERRAWLSRRIRIESLGDTPPTLAPEDVAEAMRDSRRAARDCIREHGGFRALREAFGRSRSADAGRRGFAMSFEVAPDGTVVSDSVAIEPAPPPPFYDCFAESIAQTTLPSPGEEGARVEMDLGRGRGRGGSRPRRGDGEAAPRE